MNSSGKVSYFLLPALLVMVLIGMFFRQDISDYLALRGYNPTAEIQELATNTGMTEEGKRIFYINHPQVADKDTFNKHCREDQHSIVLGCYLSGQNGIYILDVTDERLNGIEEVTSAHEMLHASYERLSSAERSRIDGLLAKAYDSAPSRVREVLDLYKKQDESKVPSEMHSILGTEVRNLSPELEEYYSRYFSDRSTIVTFSEQYDQAFIERKNQIREYDQQLSTLKTEIDQLEASIKSQEADLATMKQQMASYRSSGNTELYNELVPRYNVIVNKYNGNIDYISAQIVRYNDTVQKRNGVVTEEEELVKAIDSRDFVPAEQ